MCDECEHLKKSLNRRRAIQFAGVTAGIAALSAVRLNLGRAEEATPTASPPVHWTYEGEEGPEHWGELDPAYASCSGGTQQSPIDISVESDTDLPNIEFSYQEQSPLHIINNGHTIQVNAAAGSSITLEGTSFELKQFHFHTPSEHKIDGVGQAMEMHMVHMSAEGEIAVIGVLLKEGAENTGLKSVFEAMPVMAGPVQEVSGGVDPNALLPGIRTTYRYMGSLTTPPCTEGVHWLLMTEPAELSSVQIEAYRQIFEHDARPVQPLNDRMPEADTTP